MMAMAFAEDDDWNDMPTALEAAHYDEILRRQNIKAERMRKEREARNREIFGDCLLKLTRLGVSEKQGRSMLGKWRGQAKDDALLVRVIAQASEIGAPDPISYVTKALAGTMARKTSVADMQKGKWVDLGWEAPRITPLGPEWRNGTRGRVWRDPFGNLKVLPVEKGMVVPSLEEEPGIEVKGVA